MKFITFFRNLFYSADNLAITSSSRDPLIPVFSEPGMKPKVCLVTTDAEQGFQLVLKRVADAIKLGGCSTAGAIRPLLLGGLGHAPPEKCGLWKLGNAISCPQVQH